MKIFHSVFPPEYHEKKIHPNTIKNLDKWVNLSSDVPLERVIFDYSEAIEFLTQQFPPEIVEAFILQPEGRFKSDIWRLCALWVYGGVYCDIDQEILQPFISQLDIESLDFVGCSNSSLTNLSNGFLYAKKHSKIIHRNIEILILKYLNLTSVEDLFDAKVVGGCDVAGEVIKELTGKDTIPLGYHNINGMKCLFLHEMGDNTLNTPSTERQFWDSFKVYNPLTNEPLMNSRYKGYNIDRYQPYLFQPIT